MLLGVVLIGAGFIWLTRKERAAEETLHLPAARTGTDATQALEILSQPVPHTRPISGTIGGAFFGAGVALLLVGVITVFLPKPAPPVPDKTDLIRMAREQYGLVLVDADQAPPTTVKVLAPETPPPAVVVKVVPGDTATAVADKLLAAKLVPDRQAFLQRLTERHLDTALKVGEFSIPTNAPLDKIIDLLTSQNN